MITSTSPAGIALATWTISVPMSHDDNSVGESKRLQRPPAWAATTTIDAPRDLSADASRTIAGASGAIVSPRRFAAIVVTGVLAVVTPMRPTLTPATSIKAEGLTLGQATGAPVVTSTTLAARNGKRAWAARAFSAPRGSSDGDRGVDASPTGPKSNS